MLKKQRQCPVNITKYNTHSHNVLKGYVSTSPQGVCVQLFINSLFMSI